MTLTQIIFAAFVGFVVAVIFAACFLALMIRGFLRENQKVNRVTFRGLQRQLEIAQKREHESARNHRRALLTIERLAGVAPERETVDAAAQALGAPIPGQETEEDVRRMMEEEEQGVSNTLIGDPIEHRREIHRKLQREERERENRVETPAAQPPPPPPLPVTDDDRAALDSVLAS